MFGGHQTPSGDQAGRDSEYTPAVVRTRQDFEWDQDESLSTLRDLLRPRHDLIIENLALRQQILVLERSGARPWLHPADKAFWVALSRCWRHWRRPLRLVKPSTVIAWRRRGWRWKSRPGKGGRLSINVSEATVAKYMIKRGNQPSQNWQTFIRNHLPDIVAIENQDPAAPSCRSRRMRVSCRDWDYWQAHGP